MGGATSASNEASRAISQVGYNLVVIALFAVLGGIALAYGITALSRSAPSHATYPGADIGVVQNLAGRELRIPLGWFRYPESRQQGFAEQIQLTLPFTGASGTEHRVDVDVMPRSRIRPSASLLDAVYLHLFLPDQIQGPPGLVGKPLRPTEGFAGETVWYDPLSAQPFVAKCMAPVEDGGRETCVRTVMINDTLGAVYSFDRTALADWRAFDPAMKVWFGMIGLY